MEIDGPEGEVPVLLQTLLSRHPKVFLENRTGQRRVQGGKAERRGSLSLLPGAQPSPGLGIAWFGICVFAY